MICTGDGCEHNNIRPVVEKDGMGQKWVFVTVCLDCLKEFSISPMLYSDYLKLVKA